jgi:hypothetical protein
MANRHKSKKKRDEICLSEDVTGFERKELSFASAEGIHWKKSEDAPNLTGFIKIKIFSIIFYAFLQS